MSLGTGGVFDYAVRTAATVGESLAVASRYSRLLSDSFRINFEVRGSQAIVQVDDEAGWPRPASDFSMSALYKLHVAELAAGANLQCWFQYSEPRDTATHRRAFSKAALKFDAPFYGFVFDAMAVSAPMPGRDPTLHSLLCSRADTLMADLASARHLTATVRRLVAKEISSGEPSAERVARSLNMSRRTLSRRLERERTTFLAEVDAVRREVALDRVKDARLPLSEVSFLSGFSHVESFHRAFKRWTGQTPLAYRSAQAAAQITQKA
jgi:AraC-like DNA-binding protein